MKSLEAFINQELQLVQYCSPGDEVDVDFYNYFMNIVDPVTFSSNGFQVGEIEDYKFGRAVYPTFEKMDGRFFYRGLCHRGYFSPPIRRVI